MTAHDAEEQSGPRSPRRSGRRPGVQSTREDILSTARKMFAGNGFEMTTVRAIAAAAGVDPALVHHYYGTKRELFVAAVAIPVDPAVVLAPLKEVEVDELGAQLVRTVLGLWDDGEVRPAGLALLRSAVAGPGAGLVRSFLSEIILSHIGARLSGDADEVAVRTGLVASQMLGLIVTRYVVELEPLASMPLADLAECAGPTLQRYLTGPMPVSGS